MSSIDWRARLSCVAVVLFAFAIRCYRLGEVNYWFDETFSLRLAEFSLQELISRSAQDTHPPLFFIGLKLWSAVVGQSPWMARFWSVLWSLGAVACAFCFVREAGTSQGDRGRGLTAAVIAALLLALSPLQLTWAQQVRMYAPVECLSVLSTWLLWRAIQNPNCKSRWVWFAVVEIIGLYTHVTMLFVAAGHFGALILLELRNTATPAFRRPTLVYGISAMVAAGICYAPWFLIARSQQARVQQDFWSEPFEWRLLGDAMVKCFGNPEWYQVNPQVGYWIGEGLIVLLVMLALGRSSFDLLVTSTAAVPFMAIITASVVGRNILHPRYFISGQTLVCVAVAVLVTRLPWRRARFAISAVLLGGQAVLAYSYFDWRQQAAQQPGVPGVLDAWQEHRRRDDVLIFSSPMSYTTARIYAGGASQFRVFGSQDCYTFFVGTAIMSDCEYVSSAEIDGSAASAVWVCDFGSINRFMQPAALSDSWTLAAEKVIPEFNGVLILRRYDRRPQIPRGCPAITVEDAARPRH